MARTAGSDGRKTAQRILTKAERLVAQYGYSAVSMRMIADAVGVNVGAIYNHFPNKQNILVKMMIDHMHALLAAWNAVDLSDTDAAQKMDHFVRFHIAHNLTRTDAVFISFMELRSLEEEGAQLIGDLRTEYENAVRMIIAEGIRQGQFQVEDAHVAAMSVLGSLVGVNTWYRSKGRLSKEKIQDYYVAMTLRSVGYDDGIKTKQPLALKGNS